MSKSEDYLDQLLKGVSREEDTLEENIFSDILEEFADGTSKDEEKEEIISEDEGDSFDMGDLKENGFDEEDDFKAEFLEDDFLDEEFLKEFEMEVAKLEQESEKAGSQQDTLSLFDDLDSILSGAKAQMEAVEPEPEVVTVKEIEPEPEIAEEPVLAGIKVTGEVPDVETPTLENGFSFADLFAADGAGAAEKPPQEDTDVLKILEGLDGIDLELEEENGEQQDFSELEGFLAGSAASNIPEVSELNIPDFSSEKKESVEDSSKSKKKKSKENGEQTGFMDKLGKILFGENDDEDEEDNKKKEKVVSETASSDDFAIGVASEEELAMFGEFSGGGSSAGAESANKKGKKEKKKKEKKEKPKKEKKPKKPKPKKEKKPKKPKEPDNTPPLPKKPVILIFLMVASFVSLVLIGANLLGYSNQITNAKNQYAKKNYSEAFAEISGIKVKEEDLTLYNKYHVMAMVSVELEAYESLMSQEFYDMALDCLVRTIGRAEKYRTDAESYGCIQELNELEQEAEEILSQTFGMSKEDALEFYSYRSKKEYSTAIANVIKEVGLEKVTE